MMLTATDLDTLATEYPTLSRGAIIRCWDATDQLAYYSDDTHINIARARCAEETTKTLSDVEQLQDECIHLRYKLRAKGYEVRALQSRIDSAMSSCGLPDPAMACRVVLRILRGEG